MIPLTTLGILAVVYFLLPGSSRSGEYPKKNVSPTFRPDSSSMGNSSSSVVPG